jgi:hypothetical protein
VLEERSDGARKDSIKNLVISNFSADVTSAGERPYFEVAHLKRSQIHTNWDCERSDMD